MSSLWTPSGEHFPKGDGNGDAPPPDDPENDTDVTQASRETPLTEEQAAAQAEVDAMRAQLAHTPAEVVGANHCYGLFELAAIYLSQNPPQLFQAPLPERRSAGLVRGSQGPRGGAGAGLGGHVLHARPALRESGGGREGHRRG